MQGSAKKCIEVHFTSSLPMHDLKIVLRCLRLGPSPPLRGGEGQSPHCIYSAGGLKLINYDICFESYKQQLLFKRLNKPCQFDSKFISF